MCREMLVSESSSAFMQRTGFGGTCLRRGQLRQVVQINPTLHYVRSRAMFSERHGAGARISVIKHIPALSIKYCRNA